MALGVFALQATACGSDDDPSGPEVDVTGSYSLLSFTFDGQLTLTPPAAQGTLVLLGSRYEVDITLETIAGTQVIQDVGTYTVDGTSWSQTSDDGLLQSVGTFNLDNGVLTVDLTTQGQRILNIWRKN